MHFVLARGVPGMCHTLFGVLAASLLSDAVITLLACCCVGLLQLLVLLPLLLLTNRTAVRAIRAWCSCYC